MFPIEMWNQHQEVIQGIPRTNNSVACHKSFNATVGCHQPNIWRFIDALKREQGLVEVKLNFLLEKHQLKDKETKPMKRDLKVLS